jgi:hypothetical protein
MFWRKFRQFTKRLNCLVKLLVAVIPVASFCTNDAAIQIRGTISVRTMSGLNFSRGIYGALIEAASHPHRIFTPRQLFLEPGWNWSVCHAGFTMGFRLR